MINIPIFGNGVGGIGSKSMTVTAQRRLNCYYDVRPDGDKGPEGATVILYGTPGKTLFVNLGFGIQGRGAHLMPANNLVYIVCGATLFEVNSAGVATSKGTVTLGTNLVAMADNGNQLLICDGTFGWIFNKTANTLTKIVSANFPQTSTSCCFNDGYFLVNDPANAGRFWKSALLDGTTWSATDFATAQSNPDALTAISCYHGTIIMFGSQSIEFWQDLGSALFPYAPIVSATLDWGLAAQFSVAVVSDSLMFLGQYNQGKPQIVMLSGTSIEVVSISDIDAILETFTVTSDATGLSYMVSGHAMYQINFPSASRSFLYDVTTDMWGEVQYGVGLTGRDLGNIGFQFGNSCYVLDYQSNGNVYRLDPLSYTDNGMAIKRQLRSRHILKDLNMIGIGEIVMDFDMGNGLQSGQGSNPQIMLQVSKDNGKTYGMERWTSMGKVGQYLGPRAIWRRLGAARDFVLQWTVTDPVPFTVTRGSITPMVRK